MARRRKKGGLRKRGEAYFVHYYVDGRRYHETAKTGDRRVAESFLALRLREIREGTWEPSQERRRKVATSTTAEYLDHWIERRKAAGVRNVRDETQWFRDHVKPAIGALALDAVTRRHVQDLVTALRRKPSQHTGKPYSSRTVLHVYRTLGTAFSDAVLDGLIPTSPCTLRQRRGELPAKKDADPKWRAEAVYSRDEIETLLSDESIPLERRVMYGLMSVAGLRGAEATGRRWRDYDPEVAPLGRLTVGSQADGNKGERGTKTGDVREVPVIPALASLLAQWKLHGFALRFGRRPRPEDPIVPGPRCKPERLTFRGGTTVYTGLRRDLEKLQLRRVPALRHSMRATFLTLLEADGANMAIARRCTHSAPTDVVSGYVRTSWNDVCREVAKLNIDLHTGADVIPIRQAVGAICGAIGTDGKEKPLEYRGLAAPDAGLEPATNRLTADRSTN